MTYARRTTAALVAAAAALSGAGLSGRGDPRPGLPDGWRWEAFRGVQLAVPGEWGHANGEDLLALCEGVPAPAVGRPGSVMLSARCPDPGTDAAVGGQFVVFETRRDGFDPRYVSGGDRVALEVGAARVLVQAPGEVRRRILDSLHEVDTDANGCAVRDAISRWPERRPAPAVDVRSLTRISGVSGCLYDVADPYTARHRPGRKPELPPLTSSVRLTGPAAARAVAAIADAPAAGPVGTGQDAPGCTSFWGDEIVVLLVDSGQGRSRLHLRFSGCRHNGVDDGVNRRVLVRDGTYPFVSGASQVYSGHLGGGGKLDAFGPQPPAQP
jgi:hypothetical protein